ncbi:MAG: hypothetical protein JST39_03030 [Bacteroidetes bacterium]|nr:hypothetical protein [Bacteroidota bacterium]
MHLIKKAGLLCALVLPAAVLHAQTTDVKINDLNVPTSPAFVLMDKSPASIEKPTNPKALSVSLFNLLQGGAVEFTPYWFRDRPAYTFSDYFNRHTPIFETLAFSGASFKKDTISYAAGGFRTQLFRLYSPALRKDVETHRRNVIALLANDPDSLDLGAIEKESDTLKMLKAKTTFNIELAGAYLGQASSFKSLGAVKSGAWLNVRWSPYKFPLDIVALGRYSRAVDQTKSGKDSVFFDYGLSLSYQEKNFDLAFEYVNRRDIANKADYHRLALVANYQVMSGIVAVASVGKDFDKVNNVLAVFGIKFGLSKEKASLK